jgi:hypothetical protein
MLLLRILCLSSHKKFIYLLCKFFLKKKTAVYADLDPVTEQADLEVTL